MPFQEVSLKNTKKAFSAKDNKQLKRSLFLFRLLGNAGIVNIFSKLTLFAMKLGLPIKGMIKATIFKQFCGGESLDESKEVVKKLKHSHVGSILDYSVEGKETIEDFENTAAEVLKIISLAKEDLAIPYTSLKITGVAPFHLLEKISASIKLSPGEEQEFENVKERINKICEAASNSGVPIYFDAEESWVQNCIDQLAEEMMMKYNSEKAIVLTTLQMYRWDRMDYLRKLILDARLKKYFIGIKLVRGAYLEKENKRAVQMGYRSPMQVSKHNTDIAFDEAVVTCLKNIDLITLCAGTHNEASTMFLIDKMKEYMIEKDDPHVYFSQLYGMSDHITYNLADAGYNVTKYLPYGPVKAVVPYLIRRAQENTAIAGQMSRELKLIIEEKKRRVHSKMLVAGK